MNRHRRFNLDSYNKKTLKVSKNLKHPLLIVFYVDEETYANQDIMQTYSSSINDLFIAKNYDCMAFFLPTKKDVRIECLNPEVISFFEKEKYNKLIKEIETFLS